MIDWIAYSPVPYEEQCQSIGRPNYSAQAAYEECVRTIALLRILFGREPDGACLSIGSNPHDAGVWHDVRCWFGAGNAHACAYALAIGADFPVGWHDERVRDRPAKHGAAPEPTRAQSSRSKRHYNVLRAVPRLRRSAAGLIL